MADRQLSLAESLMHPRLGSNRRLDDIGAAIDWRPLEGVAAAARPAREVGRPAYAALPLLKGLYLQMLYALSDAGLEEALIDRLSFRRFCGYGLDEATPDETTICRFRQTMAAKNVLAACFEEVNRQLDRQALFVRKGTMLDATLIQACSRKPDIKQGKTARVAREPGANFTRKNGKSYFGYRLHVGVDGGSILIRKLAFTPASINESLVAEALICGDEKAVYADKGYENKHRRARLKAAHVKDRICHRANKHRPRLPHWKNIRNGLIAKCRAPIESVFGTMKRTFGFARARSVSIAVNIADAFRFATIFNLRRAASLRAQKASPA
jgi:transposase, IS5 family